jgi:hypothetical protein
MKHSVPVPVCVLVAALAVVGLAPDPAAAQTTRFTDKAAFLAATGSTNATGPLPDLGLVVAATVGSATFSVAPGGDNLAIGGFGTLADPDWYALLPGNDIALGNENLQVDLAAPMYAVGFDFAQPDATMPAFGGSPVDSTYVISLYDGATLVGQSLYSAIPTDVVTFLGLWSSAPFTTVTIIDVTLSPFADDDEYFGEFYTGAVPYSAVTLTACTDKAAFLAGTGVTSATGPLPDLGAVVSAKLGSVTLSVGPGGDDLLIGPHATGAEPDWCPLLPGNDIAQGFENLQVVLDAPVTSFGLDFVQPDATMPPFGGTPIDSTFELNVYAGGTLLGQVVFSNIPVDVPTFLGVCSNTPFDRVTLTDITPSVFVDDDEYYGEMYTGPGPVVWTNLGYGLAGISGDPLLSGTGPLTAGSSGALDLVNAAPSTPAFLVISGGALPTPLLCGTVVPWPPLVILTVPTDSLGTAQVPWSSWSSTLSGASLYFQYGLLDASAICGVSMSNALRADVP